jgi:hypothetical protein
MASPASLLFTVLLLLLLLQAAVLGVEIRRHRELGFRPGEVRVLLLSDTPFDAAPMTLPCPRPPACR